MSPNNQNKTSLFILTVIICVIILGLAIWWSSSQPATAPAPQPATPVVQTPQPTETVAPASGLLKTYANANYGFQIEYPNSLPSPSQTFSTSPVVMGGSGLSVQELHASGGLFYDSTLSNRSGQCLLAANSGLISKFFYFKDIETISGATAYHYVDYPNINPDFCFNSSKCFYYDIYRISNNGSCYEIIYQRNGGPVVFPDDISQMIASFKFTN